MEHQCQNVTFRLEKTDVSIEQTATKSKETIFFKVNKQVDTFSYKRPMNLKRVEKPILKDFGEPKVLLAVTAFGTCYSVSNINDKNKSFSITTPFYLCLLDQAEKLLKKIMNY